MNLKKSIHRFTLLCLSLLLSLPFLLPGNPGSGNHQERGLDQGSTRIPLTQKTNGDATPQAEGFTSRKERYQSYLTIQFYLNQYMFRKAKEEMDRFLETHPDDPFILTEKASLVQQLENDTKTAFQLLDKALNVYPDYYFANYLKASILFFNDAENPVKVSEAVTHLERAIQDNDQHFDSYYLLGIILSDRGDYAQSNRNLEQALRLDQKLSAYYYMASNYKALKNIEKEIATYQRIIAINPDDFKALQSLSKIYMKQEKYKQALTLLEKLWLKNPGTPQVSYDYLYALYAAGEYDKFLEISRSVRLDDSPLLIYAKGLVLSRAGRFDEALKFISSLKQEDSRTSMLKTEILIRKQDSYAAYKELDKVKPVHRNNFYFSLKFQTLSYLGLNQRVVDLFHLIKDNQEYSRNLELNDYYTVFYAYAALNKLTGMREAVDFAAKNLSKPSPMFQDLQQQLKTFSVDKPLTISTVPLKYPSNFYLLLNFYKHHQGNTAHPGFLHATAALRKLTKNSKDARPYLELVDISLKQERFDEVEQGLAELVKKFPKDMTTANFYAYFLALRNKNLEYALELSAQTIKKDPENPAYLDTYGYVLFQLNRLPEALRYLRKAFAKTPFDEEIMEHMSRYYRMKENKTRIIEFYKNAIDNGVDFKDKLIEKLKKLREQSNDK